MGRFIKWFFSCAYLLLLVGCSNDDMPNESSQAELEFKDITFLTEDNFQILQVDLLNDAEDVVEYNISTSLGLSAFDFLDVHNNLLTFFTLNSDTFKVDQYNISSFETLQIDRLCSLEQSEFRRGPIVSENVIGFVSTQSNVIDPMNFLTTYNKNTDRCTKTILGRGSIVGSRYIDNNTMFFTLIDENGNYVIKRINLENLFVGEALIFTEIFKATIENDNIHVFFFDNSYEIYDKNSLQLKSSSTFNIALLEPNPGLFTSLIKDNILYTEIPYLQPSPLPSGPAAIDLSSSQYTAGEDELAIRLRQQLNDLYGVNVELTDYLFDLENDIIIYGFDVGPILGEGGILYTNFEGELLKVVDLDYAPIRLIYKKSDF